MCASCHLPDGGGLIGPNLTDDTWLRIIDLPALARAKDKAHAIRCVANLKQIGLAFQLYADDSSEYFPTTAGFNGAGALSCCLLR